MKKLSYIIPSMILNRVVLALIVMTVIATAALSRPLVSLAQEQNCVQVYGGGVVCGAAAPEHKPVPAGLGDNLALLGGAFLLTSGVLLYFSRRLRQASQLNQ